MSVEIVDAAGGILTVRLTGRLTQPELAAAQKRAAEILRQQGKMRLLVLAEGFQGWDQGADWSDVSFEEENDPRIEKMAIVGEEQWKDLTTIFVGKWLREFPIEFFPPSDLAQARAWLAANP